MSEDEKAVAQMSRTELTHKYLELKKKDDETFFRWTESDVRDNAKDNKDVELTDEELERIVESCRSHMSAEHGWEQIDDTTDEILNERDDED